MTQDMRLKTRGAEGFTLIELIVAITLVSMVLLSIVAVDIASRKFFHSADLESRVQNEASPILERIAKDLKRAYGTDSNPGVLSLCAPPPCARMELRHLDSNSPPTYGDFSDDPWVAYEFFGGGSNIIQRQERVNESSPWGTWEVIGRNIDNCGFTIAADDLLNQNLWVTISLTARYDMSRPVDSNTNPEVTLQTRVAARSQSIH